MACLTPKQRDPVVYAPFTVFKKTNGMNRISLRWSLWALSFGALLTLPNCSGSQGLNLFSADYDIELGQQVAAEIAADPKQFPLLPEQGNEEVYRYVRGIANTIVNSGKLTYKDKFAWQIKIIKDDKTLNAFCTPGGYIYVYTGLIKFLDSEDQLAGVLGHEIAHADLRHSTRQLTKVYGVSVLIDMVTKKGSSSTAGQIATGLLNLNFSREHEKEADAESVVYLCGSQYHADGCAGFFKKMEGQGSGTPEFLSTHPNPGNRIEAIEKKADELKCTGNQSRTAEYQRIKKLL